MKKQLVIDKGMIMKKRGIVTKAIGGFFFVVDQNSQEHTTQIRGKIQKRVFPGDYVIFSEEKKIIEELLPRENLLFRPQVANVEQIIVVKSIKDPPLDKRLLDRFLIMIEAESLQPLIVINKLDLYSRKEEELKKELLDYEKAGYPVFLVSVEEKINLSCLHKNLKNRVNVLTGPSGAGKSSLINQLIPGCDLQIKEVSKKSKRGVHTTRMVELLTLPEGGWIADSPGFSSLEIDHLAPEGLAFLFPEFDSFINSCRFNMCRHTHEPGCAVKKAVEEEKISSQRYSSYQVFYQELQEKEERYD